MCRRERLNSMREVRVSSLLREDVPVRSEVSLGPRITARRGGFYNSRHYLI